MLSIFWLLDCRSGLGDMTRRPAFLYYRIDLSDRTHISVFLNCIPDLEGMVHI